MKKKLSIALSTIAFTSAAFAQAQGGFFEGSVGNTSLKIDAPGAASKKESDTSFSLLGGYMFHPNLGVEAGYVDLGKGGANYSGTVSGYVYGSLLTFTGTVGLEAKATGFPIGLRGVMPISEKFKLGARLGILSWNVDTKATVSGSGTYGSQSFSGTGSASKSFTGSDAYIGVSGSYEITKQWSAGLGFTQYRLGGDVKTDVQNLDVNVTYRF